MKKQIEFSAGTSKKENKFLGKDRKSILAMF